MGPQRVRSTSRHQRARVASYRKDLNEGGKDGTEEHCSQNDSKAAEAAAQLCQQARAKQLVAHVEGVEAL